MDISTTYKTIAFIDANVALECLDLSQLPWKEVDQVGPVLVLITATANREVDSKKNHARLGDHARRFNASLRPLASGQVTVTVRQSPSPRVDVALARHSAIDWNQFPDLDKEQADDRIIAECLHAQVPNAERKVFISHDTWPLNHAVRHGLQVYPVPDAWLRPKEKSDAERKVAQLTKEMERLKTTQPELAIEWNSTSAPAEIYRVKELSSEERRAVFDRICKKFPRPRQETSGLNRLTYDSTLDERYTRWSDELLPSFIKALELKLEVHFGQVELTLLLKNTGLVQADSLLVEVTATGGWLNEKLILVPPAGPPVPQARNPLQVPEFREMRALKRNLARHEIGVEDPFERSSRLRLMCQDFRHGTEHEYKFGAWLDPRSAAPFSIKATATAANLRGEVSETFEIQKIVVPAEYSDLIDSETLRYKAQSLAVQRAQQQGSLDLSPFEVDES